MNIVGIKNLDIENGIKSGVSVFVSGCTHNCLGCFNKEAQDFNYGNSFEREHMEKILNALGSKYIHRLTILGGEPMEVKNQSGVKNIIENVREKYPEKLIWLYSGYTFEQITDKNSPIYTKDTMDILNNIDILVDGEFVLSKKDLSLRFKGSSNQRVIDVKKTLKENKIILSEYN